MNYNPAPDVIGKSVGQVTPGYMSGFGSNERSWLYRIRPSVRHSGRFAKVDAKLWRTAPCHEHELPIAQLRWDPAPIPSGDMTFLQGVQTMTTAGDANTQAGMAA